MMLHGFMFMWLYLLSVIGLGSLYAILLTLWDRDHELTHSPVRPPSYPLAVRNPYLSTWMPSERVQHLPYAESEFWAGQQLGWSVIVRVDGRSYSLMGVPDLAVHGIQPAVVHRAEFTATHSIFDLNAGPILLKLDFFSPVSPSNYLRQSLPFSYLTVEVGEARGHQIQVYSDIDGRWTGQGGRCIHEFETQDDLVFHLLSAEDAWQYTEADDMALWGQAVLASRSSDSSIVSALAGDKMLVRGQFVQEGDLFERVSKLSHQGVVALAHDLGNVTGTASVRFAVGYERKDTINYLGETYTGYYRADYPSTHEAIAFFLDDYQDALSESLALDEEIQNLATASESSKYAEILALSTRQAYGGIDLTISNDSLDKNDVLAFIKELSSDGNVNTVDVIMPAFPIYWVMDPDWIRLLLEPVMRYIAAGRWHLPYTIHDIGSSYPNATGHDNQQAEPMPIEECGNILILALAYSQATGDTDWTAQYIDIFQKYADYLVENGINIANQLSSNDAAGPLPNETNLAIKAAVGIKAFGEMSGLEFYSKMGQRHADLLFNRGLGTDDEQTHFVLEYPDFPTTWKIPYNLYPDVLLGLETFSSAAYKIGNDFFSSVRSEYGVPLDSRQSWAKSDWNMWLAGTLDTDTRNEFVDDLWSFMSNGKHSWPFSDRYSVHEGIPILCRARPTVGGHFALLALKGPSSLRSLSKETIIDTPMKQNQEKLQGLGHARTDL